MSVEASYTYFIELPWVTFLVYWLVASFKTRTTEKREPFVSRYGVTLLLVLGYYCLFGRGIPIPILQTRFVPRTEAIVIFGGVLTWIGVAFAIWARYHLAENWSARVTIKVGHELIRSGSYSHFRHPIYSGILLATLGTAIARGELRGLLGVSLVLLAFSIKARKEEAMLTAQFGSAFGSAFEEHRRHTGFLLPRFR